MRKPWKRWHGARRHSGQFCVSVRPAVTPARPGPAKGRALRRAGRGQHGGRRGEAGRRRPASLARPGAAAAQWARPFPPCCGAQSLCGAGPGLGLDRTVPGTMVSTGPAGPARRGELCPSLCARRAALRARMEPDWPGPAAGCGGSSVAMAAIGAGAAPPGGPGRLGGARHGLCGPRYCPRCRPAPRPARPVRRRAGPGLGRGRVAAGRCDRAPGGRSALPPRGARCGRRSPCSVAGRRRGCGRGRLGAGLPGSEHTALPLTDSMSGVLLKPGGVWARTVR